MKKPSPLDFADVLGRMVTKEADEARHRATIQRAIPDELESAIKHQARDTQKERDAKVRGPSDRFLDAIERRVDRRRREEGWT
jgi:hypothetical protein